MPVAEIVLGPEIGKGGQSVVHEVLGQPDLVFKAFHDPPPADIEPKLAAMIRHNQSAGIPVVHGSHVAIAWPQRMYRLSDGRIGYTMYRAQGAQKLFLVYNPYVVAQRGWNVDASFRRRVAYNVAVMVSAIHAGGYVIGDLNESNILVTARGLVVIIDTDSFQAELEGRLYRCPVAKPEYLAPELAGVDIGSVKRERSHDNFALGVLIFQILMNGRHPFAGRWPSTVGDPPPIGEQIKSGMFSYGGSAYVAGRRITPPPGAPPFDLLPGRVRDYFMRCFVAGHMAPRQRPSAQEWVRLLAPGRASSEAPSTKPAPRPQPATPFTADSATPVAVRRPQSAEGTSREALDLQRMAKAGGRKSLDKITAASILVALILVALLLNGRRPEIPEPDPAAASSPSPSERPSTVVAEEQAQDVADDGSGDAVAPFPAPEATLGGSERDRRRLDLLRRSQVTNKLASQTIRQLGKKTDPNLPRLAGLIGPLNALEVYQQSGGASVERSRQSPSVSPTNTDVDNTAPRVVEVVRTGGREWRTRHSPSWLVRFSEPVRYVNGDDFSVTIGSSTYANANLTVARSTEGSVTYKVVVSASDISGVVVRLSFSGNQNIKDVAGNELAMTTPIGTNDNAYYFDNVPPRVIVNPTDRKIDDTRSKLTLTFTEAVYGTTRRTAFTDSTLANLIDLRTNDKAGAEVPFTASIDTDKRHVTIDPIGILPVRTWMRVKSAYYDTVGNRGAETSAVFAVQEIPDPDTTRPTVTIAGDAASDTAAADEEAPASPRIKTIVRQSPAEYRTGADSVTWRITFDQEMRDVDADDFVIDGGIEPAILKVESVDGAHDAYDVTLDSRALAIGHFNGPVILSIADDSTVEDVAGNRLKDAVPIGANHAYHLDKAPPRVTVNPADRKIDDARRNLTLTFTEAVYSDKSRTAFTGLKLANLIDLMTNGEAGAEIPFTASIDADNNNNTVTIDPIGILPVRTWMRVKNAYYDTAGNRGDETIAVFAVQEIADPDTTRPTVTIVGVPATADGPFMATFIFSEAVAGFTEFDVAVTNGSADAIIEVVPRRQWHVRVTPTGDYRVSLAADQVIDLAGNGNATSIIRTGEYGVDVSAPRLSSIVRLRPPRSPAMTDSVTWRVTFSEDMVQFNHATVRLEDESGNGIPVSSNVSAVGNSAATYDVTFSGGDLAAFTGTVRLRFAVIGSGGVWESVHVQDKSGNKLRCCRTLGADQRNMLMLTDSAVH